MSDEKRQRRIEWRDDFATGVASIDHEHEELVGLINDVFSVLESEDKSDDVSGLLAEIHDRISAHFALEEKVMRDRAYEDYRIHKDDHEDLLDDIRDIMDAQAAGNYATRREAFFDAVESWFVNHFKTMDSKLHRLLG